MSQDESKAAALFPPPRFWVILGLTGFFLVIVFASLGFPENTQAFVWLAMVVVLCLASLVDRFWYVSAFLLATLFLLVLVGHESNHIVDIRGGRQGIEIRPGEFRFSRTGPNTRLLEEFLGPLAPEWSGADIRHMSFWFGRWKDGDERFHTRSIIYREYLPDLLDLLPHREARVQVLECSTDPNNLVKLHQEMLLVAVKELGYPPGYDAHTWWDKHNKLFVAESVPRNAVMLAGGWVRRMKEVACEKTLLTRHAWYAWQGQLFITDDFFLLDSILEKREAGQATNLQKHGFRDLGMNKIAWWPVSKKN